MIWIGRAVVIIHVARVAIRWQRRVIVVHVAHRAGHGRRRQCVITGQRERRVVVVEGAIRPEHRVVTDLTSSRESGRNMVHRCSCIVVIGLVTRDTGSVIELVVVVDVALSALRAGQVEAGQRPAGG